MVAGNLRKIWWNQDRHLLDVTAKILQNHLVRNLFHQTHCRRSTFYESTCPKTQIVRCASVRKLQGQLADVFHKSHTLRATKFCDLVTADHQVFCAEGESRSDQRCALFVQDLATQWIQSYPCKNTNFRTNDEKSVEVSRSWKKTEGSHTLPTHWNFETRVKIFNGHHCAS